MPLELTLRVQQTIPIEVDELPTARLLEASADEIRKLPVSWGNRAVPLRELFDVHGSALEDRTLIWRGDLKAVKGIGAAMAMGTVRIDGSAGMHTGSRMAGGVLEVAGDVADWAGAEMSGGLLRIQGNAGNSLGGAYRGARKGMTGGMILVHGNAGTETGHSLRRGTIAVAGNVGEMPGFGMLAGTILIGGTCGARPGACMKRGSIVLMNSDETAHPELLPTFQLCCQYRPGYLRILLGSLQSHGFPIPQAWWTQGFTRYCGDGLELNRGELLIANHMP